MAYKVVAGAAGAAAVHIPALGSEGTSVTPEELSAAVLEHLIDSAKWFLDDEVESAVCAVCHAIGIMTTQLSPSTSGTHILQRG